MRLSERDYRQFNHAVAELYVAASYGGPLPAIATALSTCLGGEVVCVSACRGTGRPEVALTQDLNYLAEPEIVKALACHPRAIFGSPGQVSLISDFMNVADWQGNLLYLATRPFFRIGDDLGVDLLLVDGTLIHACVIRGERSFRAEDRELFSLLLPHLRALFRMMAPCPAHPDPLADLGLTPREQEVLRWLAESKTNREIATILEVSPGTIKNHLAHIYLKLGVENRSAAARTALEKMFRPRADPLYVPFGT